MQAFVLKDGRLALRVPGERDLALFAGSESKFFSLVNLAEFEFVRDAAGKVTRVDCSEGGAVQHGERVEGS